MSALSAKFFHDEAAAYAKLESLLWPEGPVCPHCKGMARITPVKGGRIGLRRCGPCKKQFTVTVGTVFESSHVKLNIWLQVAHLLCTSKKGISSHQIHRTIGVTYKTAWFMTHRLREAMASGAGLPPMGGLGAIVEADETYVGKQDHVPHRTKGYWTKNTVLTLVDRSGEARSFHVSGHATADLAPYLNAHISKHAVLVTDEGRWYTDTGKGFLAHHTVNHGQKEWKRGYAHTNTVEGFFSVFKRGMSGVYQHCSEKHLHRYLAEFDFRYSNRVKLGCGDAERTERALKGIVGKRLMYQGTRDAHA